ncbi:MAG: biotin synthase BioB [bacterium]
MGKTAAIAERLLAGGDAAGRDEALWLARSAPFDELLFGANRLRSGFRDDVVHLCSVVNAKSGACPEDCAFCAQSARYETSADVYPLVPEAEMTSRAWAAAERGADHFGIVTSGESACANRGDFETICAAAEAIGRAGAVEPCVSIGRLEPADLDRLKAAGLRRIHHNLETSERFYPQICTTHSHADRVATVRNAKAAGLEVCCGGLFGLGETWADRVDLALRLRQLDVDSVPINFLNPVPGTPLGGRPLLEPREALRIIALFRFVLPGRTIKVCGGREVTLRDLQSWMFAAGASGTMIGHYLTTAGRDAADDLQMLADLGLTPKRRDHD